jgi:hypothetical protein
MDNSLHLGERLYIYARGVTKRCRLSWLTNMRHRIWAQMRGGEEGGCRVSAQPMRTAVHRSPNKLWRSNSIYNLWFTLLTSPELPDVIHENPRDESNCCSCWHHSQLFQSLLVRRHPKISKNRPPEQKYFFLQIVVVEHSRSGLTVQKFERAISLRFLGIILGVLRLEVSVWIS